jgi:hypothetical protein
MAVRHQVREQETAATPRKLGGAILAVHDDHQDPAQPYAHRRAGGGIPR